MAEKMFKVNEVIEIVYQAPNKETGLGGGGVVAEIYLPSDAKDSDFPDVELVEIGIEGIYNGTFTPDEQGEWKVIIHKSDGDGQVVKRYSVGAHNVDSIGTDMAKDATVAKSATVAKEATLLQTEVDIRGADSDTLKTLSDQIDSVDSKVGSLDTPPMVS